MKVNIAQKNNFSRLIPWILTIGGAIGFLAAFIITYDKFELLINPAFVPSCNMSPIVSCGAVMKSWQAGIFGFPNPLLGIAGFSVVITVGMALLAGATFKRWFWLGLQAGTILGVIFVHWLFYQSVYVIGALCPYCMVVWAVTIPIFLYTTLYNIKAGNINLPHALHGIQGFIQKYHITVLYLWYLAIIVAILIRFWSYWSSLI